MEISILNVRSSQSFKNVCDHETGSTITMFSDSTGPTQHHVKKLHHVTLVCQIERLNCTARQCSPLRQKFIECSINNPALSLLMKHLAIGQRLKTPYFSAFHWSPRGSLVSIGQYFVATRVVHLPKSTETSLLSESDKSGPYHQLLQLCMASTAWSNSDQAVPAHA